MQSQDGFSRLTLPIIVLFIELRMEVQHGSSLFPDPFARNLSSWMQTRLPHTAATSAILTPTKQQATPTNASSNSAKDAALLRNAKYQLGNSVTLADIVQLKDGKFERGAPGDANYASVQLTAFVASGELDTDHANNEITALFAENYGGSGVFVYLTAFANENGTPTFITSTLVDDRPQLNSLSIKNNRILLDSIIHS